LLVAGATILSPAGAARAPYETGETVRVNGVVTDAAGTPIGDLEIVIEAARLGLHLGPIGKAPKEVVRGATRTDASGQFALQWAWDPRFDRFELVVAVPVQGPGGPDLHVLSRTDITRRVLQGSPVAMPTILEDVSFLETLRAFLAELDTADERRVYAEMGRPDRVETTRYPGRTEVSWWYFEAGKVFRFEDGSLAGSRTFDPVRPL
jgi:hypothetical protein